MDNIQELRKSIEQTIEESKTGDWLYDGENEYYEESINVEKAAANVIQLLFDKGILKLESNI
jgi:6-phosphogluconate dehydrogenase (decarboxylating)